MHEFKYRDIDIKYRKKELFIKIATTFISIFAIIVGIFKYTNEQKNILEREYELIQKQDSVVFAQTITLKKIELYSSIADKISAIIIAVNNQESINDKIIEFEFAFYGKRFLIDDVSLDSALIFFHDEIILFRDTLTTEENILSSADNVLLKARSSIKRYEY